MRRLLVSLLALALLASGCSGGDDDDDGGSATSVDEATTSPLNATDDLSDGRHFGKVTALDPAQLRMVFDRAELLEGNDAEAAANEADETVTEGGYYVVNPDDRMNRIDVRADVEVRLLRPCCELTTHTFESWLSGFLPDERTFYGTADSWYWITIEDGAVVEVEEVNVRG